MANGKTARPRPAFLRHFEWWERAYVVDWIALVGIYFLALFIKGFPTFEQDIQRNDRNLMHTFRREERISGFMLHLLAFWMPLSIAILTGVMKGSSHNLHHAVLSLCSGVAITNVLVVFLKGRVGRFRPDFLDRCQYDAVLEQCTGSADRIADGRRSFPSGHASMAFAGLGFLFLLFSAQFGLAQPSRIRSLFSSRLLKVLLCCWPLMLASYIAVSRLQDYRHFKEDVIAGAILGFTIANFTYATYWSHPFFYSSSGRPPSQPKILYRPISKDSRDGSKDRYELTQLSAEERARLNPATVDLENQTYTNKREANEEVFDAGNEVENEGLHVIGNDDEDAGDVGNTPRASSAGSRARSPAKPPSK